MRADFWTTPEIVTLTHMYTAGDTYEAIGRAVGRTAEAVRHQAKKQHLPKRHRRSNKETTPPAAVPTPRTFAPLVAPLDLVTVWVCAMDAISGRRGTVHTP